MRWTSPFLRVINRCTRTAKRVLCVTKERKREREVSTSLFFFSREYLSVSLVKMIKMVSRQMKKHQFVNQTTLELYLVLIKGVCKILSSEFPEEEKKGNNKRHRKRIEQERDR